MLLHLWLRLLPLAEFIALHWLIDKYWIQFSSFGTQISRYVTPFNVLKHLNFWTSLFKFFWDTVFMFWYTCQDLLRSLSVLEQVHSNFRHLFQVLDNSFQVFVHFLTIRHSFQVFYFGHIFQVVHKILYHVLSSLIQYCKGYLTLLFW